ncbi:hypothetical protein D9758_008645 [Tetrapyrgos nigripes]|uniref:NADH:flavin oxidoreductase/NADH oxidase N-terminal domain-containing protein n=1 Tax=Tetrapyrgos nigripes TaxID=182062 RepID=A0A8H5D5P4_9AGAR|nr:hypothetical protein D9758_008645 [Tetrapyrgos nigripes]
MALLTESYGCLFIALFFSFIIFGFVLLWIFQYFARFPKDSLFIKTMVLTLGVFGSIHISTSFAWIYDKLINKYPIIFELDPIPATALVQLACIFVIAFLSQSYFVTRIWIRKYNFAHALSSGLRLTEDSVERETVDDSTNFRIGDPPTRSRIFIGKGSRGGSEGEGDTVNNGEDRVSNPVPVPVEVVHVPVHMKGTSTHDSGGSNEDEITSVVHAKSSFIYLQLWALGRAASPGVLRAENPPYDLVSASDIPISDHPKDDPRLRPLTIPEIKEYIELYAKAASNAVQKAGFDGVEIHNAIGYLLDQFTQDVSNHRTDEYGGSVENRARFTLEVVDAVVKAVGQQKTRIRFSPWNPF